MNKERHETNNIVKFFRDWEVQKPAGLKVDFPYKTVGIFSLRLLNVPVR